MIYRAEDSGDWRIDDASGQLNLLYHADGRLKLVNNSLSGYEDAAWIDGLGHTPVDDIDYAEQTAALQNFVAAYAPHLYHEDLSFPLIEQYRKSDAYYALYVIAYVGYEGNTPAEQHIGQLELQLAPEVRIVRFLDSMDGLDYKGNG